MYVSRTISFYRRNPAALETPPAEGPYCGYLLFHDEAEDSRRRIESCCGLCQSKDTRCRMTPFPQNKLMKIVHTTTEVVAYEMDFKNKTMKKEQRTTTLVDMAFFFPVLGKPPSSSLYYVVKPDGGKKRGFVYSCEGPVLVPCCFCCKTTANRLVSFNHNDGYQQIKIISTHQGGFTAEAAALECTPPDFLLRYGWEAFALDYVPYTYLSDANGMDVELRSRTPDIEFPVGQKASRSVTVGKWYCPFFFVKEIGIGGFKNVKEQMKQSFYYKMSLYQQWVEIFSVSNLDRSSNVAVNTSVRREVVKLGAGQYAVTSSVIERGMKVFRGSDPLGQEIVLGLSLATIEKMRYDQGIGSQEELNAVVDKVFDTGNSAWTMFGCYILQETYELKRMDEATVLMTCTFTNPNQIRAKWD